ncbi:DNA-binding transcriptional activator of the SARP family [Nonomuraea solani]|uniref:DNA-binding transcriptional activator of the SARP family n=1 Tax=Nonomuraea solani TaxID=1144553 RepID=A0A1H6EMQ2_9ACTN|nr:BTAD domain-containing putative transcriptional regulator [Nonomuraea solani]SEG98195.1 DNA-binding transcriptional activator of the SARP family [Nonomuraea solani]
MGESLTLLLLGTPDLAVGGLPMSIRSAKTRALLCYLATTSGPRSRGELAELLWGERPDANARGSLRLALSELRREVGEWLDITRDHVRFLAGDGCFVDHRRLGQAPTVAEALGLWRGDFLDGVSFEGAPAFAGWLESERHRVRLLLRGLLVAAEPDGSDHMVRLARIVAALDPYDEEAHRLLMVSLAGAGNRAGALACFEELRRRLAADLGVSPAPETLAVRRDLLPRPLPARRTPLPVPATELIGRDGDVRRLRALLSRERLVTLLGPGGIGKTRLAIAAAASSETAFVSFAGVRPEAAVTTLARRLGVDLSPARPALDLLLSAFTARALPLLLVLDNLEHLPTFDPVIGEILRAAPGVRVLATSRRRLDLPGQVTITLEGLPGPDAEALFAARALAARPAFDPDREAALVAAICTATGGLPLAIELAASLLRAVPCADLAQRLGVDPGLLSAAGPAARSRHACMRTVFETSWNLLDPAGQEALAALSIFRGGCTLRSALEVARTTPAVLVRLVDHSMIRLTPSGRYTIHPLVQQLAAARLPSGSPVRRRHATHFARLLDRHAPALHDGSDTEVTRVLAAELDNIRLAWTASGEPGFLDRYWTLCLRLRLYEESGVIVRDHLARTPQAPHLRARWSWMAGVSAYQLAREKEADRLANQALGTLGERLPTSTAGRVAAMAGAAVRQTARRLLPISGTDPAGPEAAQALTLLARLAYHRQDLPVMLVASLRQLNAAERAADPALRAEAYANFATIARMAGRHGLATRYGDLADRALAAIGHPTDAANRARLARGLDQLHSGAFGAARRSFAEGRARTLDPRMAENCVGMLAETALWQGDFARAAELYEETEELAFKRVGGDDIGRYWCLTGRAEALLRVDGVPAERIGALVTAARASTDRRIAYERELGLRDGRVMRVVQDLRLLTASARLFPAAVPPGEALDRALELAERLPAAQPGMIECWTGLAELLWSLDPPPHRATSRRLAAHLTRYAARNPGAVARIGWARALVLAAAGKERAARKTADQAMTTADRLAAHYDRRRAEEITRRLQ